MIATKIQQNQYSSLGELEKDLLQMTRNACLFNEPGSQIYKDAKTLRKVISSKKIEVEHGKYQSGTGKSSERIRWEENLFVFRRLENQTAVHLNRNVCVANGKVAVYLIVK